MNVLAIGDVVGNPGCEFLRQKLWGIRKMLGVDFVMANGENCAEGNGITPENARDLFSSGVDVITGGNHVWQRREIYSYLDETDHIVRPANYPPQSPGRGFVITNVSGIRVCVINLMGNVFLESLENPFLCADRIIKEVEQQQALIIVDFHAEATSEKKSLGYYLDGRVSAVLGTHTHVQTSDETVLPGGTAYITDLGMTGVADSVLGIKKEDAIRRFVTCLPQRFEAAKGEPELQGVLIEIDSDTKKALSIERLIIK